MGYKQDLKAIVTELKAARHHFELLRVHKQSTPEELSAARKELAQVLHPDKLIANGVDPADKRAGTLMAEVNAAYAVLANGKERKKYLAGLATGRGTCPTCRGEGCRRVQRGFKGATYEACATCGGAGMV